MFKKLTVIFTLILMSFTAITYLAPAELYDSSVAIGRILSGVEKQTIEVEGETYVYLDSGNTDKPVLLLVHGFSADKDNWAMTHLLMDRRYRVISVDLLGHGESSFSPEFVFSSANQARHLKLFIDALDLKQVNLAGNSMGGWIIGMLAAQYPEVVNSLILIDSAGVKAKRLTDLDRQLAGGDNSNPLIIETADQMAEVIDLVFHQTALIPSPLIHHLGTMTAQRQSQFEKIFSDLRIEPWDSLEPLLKGIKLPVLAIWGDEDQLIDVSVTETLQEELSDLEVVLIKHTGHTPMVESPLQTVQAIEAFLAKVVN